MTRDITRKQRTRVSKTKKRRRTRKSTIVSGDITKETLLVRNKEDDPSKLYFIPAFIIVSIFVCFLVIVFITVQLSSESRISKVSDCFSLKLLKIY